MSWTQQQHTPSTSTAVDIRTGLDDERWSRSIIAATRDAMVAIDADSIVIDWNHSAETLFGWRREEVIGRSVTETIIPENFREQHLRGMEQVSREGDGPLLNRVTEVTACRRDGSEFPIELSLTPIFSSGSTAYVAFVRDITTRWQTEQRLQRLLQAVEQSPVTVLITDASGRIEYVNTHLTRLTGYLPEEVVGKTPGLFKSGRTTPDVYSELWKTITSGHQWHGELLNRKKNGELYW